MARSAGVAKRSVIRRDGGAATDAQEAIAVEEPLEIRIGDTPLAVTMRTPGHDEELAAGFCFTEGVFDRPDDLVAVRPCERAEFGNVVEVELTGSAMASHAREIERARRRPFVASSCGLCGKESIDRIEQDVSPPGPGPLVDASVLERLSAEMERAQAIFAETGGLHAAGLFDATGRLVVLREDVGRHNAVDKVIGHEVLLGRVPLSGSILLVSGRASFEIVQKAATAGISLVCAVSAPSSLAVDLAERLGMTLVGFLRGTRMNVYAGAQRLA